MTVTSNSMGRYRFQGCKGNTPVDWLSLALGRIVPCGLVYALNGLIDVTLRKEPLLHHLGECPGS